VRWSLPYRAEPTRDGPHAKKRPFHKPPDSGSCWPWLPLRPREASARAGHGERITCRGESVRMRAGRHRGGAGSRRQFPSSLCAPLPRRPCPWLCFTPPLSHSERVFDALHDPPRPCAVHQPALADKAVDLLPCHPSGTQRADCHDLVPGGASHNGIPLFRRPALSLASDGAVRTSETTEGRQAHHQFEHLSSGKRCGCRRSRSSRCAGQSVAPSEPMTRLRHSWRSGCRQSSKAT
jgi:hypothetical protein